MSRTRNERLAAFTRAMKDVYAEASSLKPPFHAPEFIRMIHQHGGKETADRLLATGDVSRGFTRLWMRDPKLLTLSMEYLVLQDPWRSLFNDEQLRTARGRLTDYRCELPPSDALWQGLDAFVRQLGDHIEARNQPAFDPLDALCRGWSHGLQAEVEYTGDALQALTWQNLGFRLARTFGAFSEETILAVFEFFTHLWEQHLPASMREPTHDPIELAYRVAAIRSSGPGKRPAPLGCAKPERVRLQNAPEVFKRDPDVIAWVRDNAAGNCELCGQQAPFIDAGGRPFLEVHHVVRLAKGGPDTTDNAVALCPNCHRQLHLASDLEVATVVGTLYGRVARLVAPPQGEAPSQE